MYLRNRTSIITDISCLTHWNAMVKLFCTPHKCHFLVSSQMLTTGLTLLGGFMASIAHTFLLSGHRFKLTFSKNHLLATFNCKMVAMKRNSVAKKTLGSGGHFEILHEGANAPNGTFSTLRFATVRERERRVCLVAKTIYFNITKLLRPGNIANGAQNSFKSIKFTILSHSSF